MYEIKPLIYINLYIYIINDTFYSYDYVIF